MEDMVVILDMIVVNQKESFEVQMEIVVSRITRFDTNAGLTLVSAIALSTDLYQLHQINHDIICATATNCQVPNKRRASFRRRLVIESDFLAVFCESRAEDAQIKEIISINSLDR